MTYAECERYISENTHLVKDYDKIAGTTIQKHGIIIATNTSETRRIESILDI
jgi:hypothetical protein